MYSDYDVYFTVMPIQSVYLLTAKYKCKSMCYITISLVTILIFTAMCLYIKKSMKVTTLKFVSKDFSMS